MRKSGKNLTNNLHFLDLTIPRMISLNRTHPGAGEVVMWLQLDGSMLVFRVIGDDEGRIDVVFEEALEIADLKCLKNRFSP